MEEQGGANLYAFVGNDPVNRWDWLGLCDESYVLDVALDDEDRGFDSDTASGAVHFPSAESRWKIEFIDVPTSRRGRPVTVPVPLPTGPPKTRKYGFSLDAQAHIMSNGSVNISASVGGLARKRAEVLSRWECTEEGELVRDPGSDPSVDTVLDTVGPSYASPYSGSVDIQLLADEKMQLTSANAGILTAEADALVLNPQVGRGYSDPYLFPSISGDRRASASVNATFKCICQ